MRRVVWTDRAGYKRAAMVRDTDPDTMGPQGIPLAPPDLEQINWEEVKRRINNALVERGLFTWQDVQMAQNAITASVTGIIRRELVLLYKLQDQEDKSNGR